MSSNNLQREAAIVRRVKICREGGVCYMEEVLGVFECLHKQNCPSIGLGEGSVGEAPPLQARRTNTLILRRARCGEHALAIPG